MADIQLITGNAIEKMKQMSSESFDAIVADPPYNLGKNYGNNNDKISFENYLSFSEEWLREAHRVLKPTGTIYVFMGVRFISYLFEIMDRKLKFHFINWITWHYTQGLGKTKGFSPRHDDILMFGKSIKYKFYLDNVRVPQKYYRSVNNMRGANPGDVWEFSHVHYCNYNRRPHPTQKPEGLIERLVLASTKEKDIVLDPFAGSGTTPRVCQQLNRNCTAIELNPDYIELIQQRLKEKFIAFDSVDTRMERVPKDLNDSKIRKEYLKNHIEWFLKNHKDAQQEFIDSIRSTYGSVDIDQMNLFFE